MLDLDFTIADELAASNVNVIATTGSVVCTGNTGSIWTEV